MLNESYTFFILDLIFSVVQAFLFGFMAFWFESSHKLLVRSGGRLLSLLAALASILVVINWITGYEVLYDISLNTIIIFIILIGWIAGRNHRYETRINFSEKYLFKGVILESTIKKISEWLAYVTYIYYLGIGLNSFFLTYAIISEQFNILIAWLSFLFFPISVTFSPLYVGFKYADWIPALIQYGGFLSAALVFNFSQKLLIDSSEIERESPPSEKDARAVWRQSNSVHLI